MYGYVLGDPVGGIDPLGLVADTLDNPFMSPFMLGFGLGLALKEIMPFYGKLWDDVVCYAKGTKKSGKEGGTDAPDWAKRTGKRPEPNQKCQDFAKQLLNTKYGNNWRTGPGTEYNQIVKWCQHLSQNKHPNE